MTPQEGYVVLGAAILVLFPTIIWIAIFDVANTRRWTTMFIGTLLMTTLSTFACYAVHLNVDAVAAASSLVGIADAAMVVSLVGLALMIRGYLARTH